MKLQQYPRKKRSRTNKSSSYALVAYLSSSSVMSSNRTIVRTRASRASQAKWTSSISFMTSSVQSLSPDPPTIKIGESVDSSRVSKTPIVSAI